MAGKRGRPAVNNESPSTNDDKENTIRRLIGAQGGAPSNADKNRSASRSIVALGG